VEANQTEYKLVVERKSNAERNCTATNNGKPSLLKEYPISNLYDENSVPM
jgi:hypothetical protein